MAGESDRIVQELEREMFEASAGLNFERAAVLRDQLAGLAKARERNTVVLLETTRADVVGYTDYYNDDSRNVRPSVRMFDYSIGRRMRGRDFRPCTAAVHLQRMVS